MRQHSSLRRCVVPVVVALALLSSLTACFRHYQGTVVSAPAAYLLFTGEAAGSKVTLDDTQSFQVTSQNERANFKVQPGRHRIRVEKNGAVVVDRTVLLSDDQTFEVSVP